MMSVQDFNVAYAFSQLEHEAYEKRTTLPLMLTNAEFTFYQRALEGCLGDRKILEKYTALMERRYANPEKRRKFIEAHKALDEAFARTYPTQDAETDAINKAYSLFPEQDLNLPK